MAGLPILNDRVSTKSEQPKRPSWIRVRAPSGDRYKELFAMIQEKRLHTVCSSAACPNIGECWNAGTATFMIMGNECTRACRFCDVKTSKRPKPLDLDEPTRLADAIELMDLDHVVLTSVTRDDLPDGGAQHFANCMREIFKRKQSVTIEVLTPDFDAREKDIQTVLDAGPAIFNHNIETVRRLTKKIRSGGAFDRSLEVLRIAKSLAPDVRTKSGVMLGLGESDDEVRETIEDLAKVNTDILTLGQYLRPSPDHHPVVRYAPPETFAELKTFAEGLGFLHIESGPLVRSSYHAERGVK